jgi:DTW domain-containing protein YfiP
VGRSSEPAEPTPRVLCPRCRRPVAVCFCRTLEPIATRTRVVILQHPRERDVGINTARLARLGLAGARWRCDVDFSGDPVVREVLAAGDAYLLFPGAGAIPVERAKFASPITLVVLDGTWWQAEKLLKANPALAALPRLSFTAAGPSRYGQIRREPADHCVATLEAVAHVLGHLEGDVARFAPLRASLDAMVASQLTFAAEIAANRHHRPRPPRPPRDPLPVAWREHAGDLVCVHGEANAWPRHHPERTQPEIVHWLARRVGTGETFAAVIAPRGRLAPSTCHHIRLPAAALAGGAGFPDFAARWRAFTRPADVLVSWGHFPVATLAADGLPLEHPHLDARKVAADVLRRRPGTVEECLAAMRIAPLPAFAPGRGGDRLASLCAVVDMLRAWPRP